MKSTFLALSLVAVPFAAFAGDPPRGHEGHDMGGPGLIKQLDKDNDGRVSRAESAQAATERANKRFDELDANKDGYLTQEEVDAARKNMRDKMKKRAVDHWKDADKDGDGAISRAEAEASMPMLNRRFDELDANKDGKITRDEMPQGKRMDAQKPVK